MKDNKQLADIKILEKEIEREIEVFMDFKNSKNNSIYFDSLLSNFDSFPKKKSSYKANINYSIGYAFIFLISFSLSFLLSPTKLSESINQTNILFSDTSPWVEEEEVLSDFVSSDMNLDFENYFNLENNLSINDFLDEDISSMDNSDLDEILNRLKDKKIL